MLYVLALVLLLIFSFNVYRVGLKVYLMRVLVSLDQFINVIFFGGYEDETLSSCAYRLSQKNSYWYSVYPRKIIDIFLFFDIGYIEKDILTGKWFLSHKKEGNRKVKHCEKSYYYEMQRDDFHKDMR